MANLRVFVSSTCYDLGPLRSQIRAFLLGIGFEPVMSDFADVLYDPRLHTHVSCLQEVATCDVLILLVGPRFGGTAIPRALEAIDLDVARDSSSSHGIFSEENKLSITQVEVLKAIEAKLPIFTFVDSGVMHDHLTYEKNKTKPIVRDIEFPRIEKQDTAAYIFEFINFLRHRVENNSLTEFTRFEDIEHHLKRQWSALFQRLLLEQRSKDIETRRIDYLSAQIADLKTVVLTSISSSELKETAKGAIRYRLLIDFLAAIANRPQQRNVYEVFDTAKTLNSVLEDLGIVDKIPDNKAPGPNRTILLRYDGTYYRFRGGMTTLERLANAFDEFRLLNPEVQEAIVAAILDVSETRPIDFVQYVEEVFQQDEPPPEDDDEIPF